MIGRAVFCCCVAAAAAALAAEPLARWVDGPPVAARLVGCDAAGNLTFDLGGQSRTAPAADLVRWGAFVEPTAPIEVELADGGVLAARELRWSDDRLALVGESVAAVALPAELVAAVLFTPPRDPQARQVLVDRLRDPALVDDRLVLDNGDELGGTLLGLADGKLQLATAAGASEIPLTRVTALALHSATSAPARLSGPRTVVGLADGSRVVAVSLVVADGRAIAGLAGGVELACDAASIVALEPLGRGLVYLSDLPNQSYKHIPALRQSWPFQRDRNVLGGPLLVRSERHLKGLGLHSAARLTYELDRTYRRLDAELAIDDAAAGGGSVELRAFVDTGDGRWQNRFASAIVRGGDEPLGVTVDLSGARRLSLVVDFADRGDERDYADLLDARLVP